MPHIILLRHLRAYYREHPSLPWTQTIREATRFASAADARARAHVEQGLADRDFAVMEVSDEDLHVSEDYERYALNFPLFDPRD